MRCLALTASPTAATSQLPAARVAYRTPPARPSGCYWAVRESAPLYATPGDVVPEAEDGTAAPGPGAIDLLSAPPAKVHGLLKTLHACGNEIRLATLDALHAMHERCLYFELGYSSYHQYCDQELGLPRSTAYEYLRAAKALAGLPQLREQLRIGEVSWAQVRAITRVATAHTEVAWIKCAWTQPVRRLLAEVREAERRGRDAPRERRYGLPNLLVKHVMELTLEEMARVRVALALVAEALQGADEDAAGRSADSLPLVRWADGVIAGSIPIRPLPADGEVGAGLRPRPAQTIVYHVCPACREATVQTDDGPVSVAPERVQELAAHANRVDVAGHGREDVQVELLPDGEVDAPNSAALARKVLHRDGLTCANPGCGRRHDLQAHHIVYRSQGGRTVLSNEVALCATCHAMIHQGLLRVSCSSAGELTWTPRPLDPTANVRDPQAVAARVGALAAAVTSAWAGGTDDAPRAPADHGAGLGTRQAATRHMAGQAGTWQAATWQVPGQQTPNRQADTWQAPNRQADTWQAPGRQASLSGRPHRRAAAPARPEAESTRETGGAETGASSPPPGTQSTRETGGVETGASSPPPGTQSTRETRGVETGPRSAAALAPRPVPSARPPISQRRVTDLAWGLRRLGCPLRETEESVREAIVDLVAQAWARHTVGDPPPEAPTDEEILLRALRGAAAAG